jgi:hypothetical protein
MNQHLERLDLLAPMLHAPMRKFIDEAQLRHGITLAVIFTWRSYDEQRLLYQQGRVMDRESGLWITDDSKKIVTNARPGTSAHNVIDAQGKPASLAADLMPIQGGTIQWIASATFWNPLYALAWRCGLDPLGDVIGSYLAGDWGHFEEPGYKLKMAGLGLQQPTGEMNRSDV